MVGDLFKQFDWSAFAFFILFALPGFISLKVWTQIVPSPERPLKDVIGEVVAFGILNAAIVAPFLALWNPADPVTAYLALILGLVVLPAAWPFILRWLVELLQKWNLILIPARTAWDYVFLGGKSYFVIVHLKDGRRIGGYYGENSFAGVFPDSGHLYLEELWTLDDDYVFTAAVPGSTGIILRPDDYAFIELKAPGDADGEEGGGAATP
jgi:hypothetical protein